MSAHNDEGEPKAMLPRLGALEAFEAPGKVACSRSAAQRAENFVSLLTFAALWVDCQHSPSDVFS